jgi:hypothetical protein
MNIWNPPDWHAIEAIGTWVAAIGTIGAVVPHSRQHICERIDQADR